MSGLAVALIRVLDELAKSPLPQYVAATPTSAFQIDRRTAVLIWLAIALTDGLAVGLVVGLTGWRPGGLAAPVLDVPSFAVLASQVILRTRATGCVRFLPLLQEANHRQVLRQAGTVYQFRHAELQDHLAEVYRYQA